MHRSLTIFLAVFSVALASGCGGGGGGGGGGSPPAQGGTTTGGSTSGGGGTGGGSTGGGGLQRGWPQVPPAPAGAATRFVSPAGSDANPGTAAAPWRTIAQAAEQARPGDIVEIADGQYAGPIYIDTVASAAAPLIFRASGTGAEVRGSGADRDAIFIEGASHVTIHGLRIFGATRAAIRISQSDHVTIQGCVCGQNGTWGIFTDYSDDIALLGNECFESAAEHGIYHSNSGDRVTIRGNYCHDNAGSGIQINADPAFAGDGITSESVIERNVCARNGARGGAALNFASVRESDIRNNLLFDNLAGGIAMWDDGYDPSSGQFGCKNNRILQNTVVFSSGEGRFCLSLANGSTGNVVKNNVFLGGRRGAIAITTNSLAGLDEDANLVASRDGWALFVNETTGASYDLAGWRAATAGAAADIAAAPLFADEAGLDFALAPGSPGRDAAGPAGVTNDLEGVARPQGAAHDMGALER